MVGYITLSCALAVILLVGVILNTGFYLTIRSIASHLKLLEDCPEKDEAHRVLGRERRSHLSTGIPTELPAENGG